MTNPDSPSGESTTETADKSVDNSYSWSADRNVSEPAAGEASSSYSWTMDGPPNGDASGDASGGDGDYSWSRDGGAQDGRGADAADRGGGDQSTDPARSEGVEGQGGEFGGGGASGSWENTPASGPPEPENASATDAPLSGSSVPETPAPEAPANESADDAPVPESSVPEAPANESAADAPVPESSIPEAPAPEAPPNGSAADAPVPESSIPEAPAPEAPPNGSAADAPVPESSVPEAPVPEAPPSGGSEVNESGDGEPEKIETSEFMRATTEAPPPGEEKLAGETIKQPAPKPPPSEKEQEASKPLQPTNESTPHEKRGITVYVTGFGENTYANVTSSITSGENLARKNADIPGREVVVNHLQQGKAVEAIKETLRENPDAKVSIVGHSFGGDSAIQIAETLEKEGIEVDLLIQIDTVGIDDDVLPDNVLEGHNIDSADLDWINAEEHVEGSTNHSIPDSSHGEIAGDARTREIVRNELEELHGIDDAI